MKKLIVLATLAALPAVAMADVTISGNLAVGIVNTKVDGQGSINSQDRTNGEIKFAGSDDLGNGLKGIWQIATRINLADTESDGNNNNWASRDSFVGLEGGFGRLTMGNIYHMPTSGAMAIFENNSATAWSDIYDQGTRVNNTVSYKTPSFAGFTATVQHSFGSSTAREATKTHQQAYSLAYEGDGFSVSYDCSRFKEDAHNNAKLHELNASVTLSDLTLQAGYARGSSQAADSKVNGWGVAASYALGNITPKFGFWREGDVKIGGTSFDTGHKAYALGVDYALSKRTRAGVEWAKVSYDNDAFADERTATVYLGTKF